MGQKWVYMAIIGSKWSLVPKFGHLWSGKVVKVISPNDPYPFPTLFHLVPTI